MKQQDIKYLGTKLQHLTTQQQKEHLLMNLQHGQIPFIVDDWRRDLSIQKFDEQFRLTSNLVEYLTKYRAQDCGILKTVSPHQFQHLCQYAQISKQYDNVSSIVSNLHFAIKCETIKYMSSLFKTLINHFQHIQRDQTREQLTLLLVDLMSLNYDFVKLANQPYYFIEFLLFKINQEREEYLIKWLEYIKKIYLSPNSQKLLTENDFKILIDVIVRHIQNFSELPKLVVYLQTYLVLSIFPFIKKNGKYHKIDQILMVLSNLQNTNEEVEGLTGQIASLKYETLEG